jgi:hypothetical protein
MKVLITATCLLLSGFFTLANAQTFNDSFDFYVYPGKNIKLLDCKINNEPCKYNEAVRPGKKPISRKAVYVGTGTIDLKQIIESEKDLVPARLTLIRTINIDLDRGLENGINTIQLLLDPQGDFCVDDLEANKMIEKLTIKVLDEKKHRGRSKSFIKGQKLLKQLQCNS